MDDFEFDDIADEDLMLAESQSGNSQGIRSARAIGNSRPLSRPPPRTINDVLNGKPSASLGRVGANPRNRPALGKSNGAVSNRGTAVDVVDLSSDAFDDLELEDPVRPAAPIRQLPKSWGASQSYRQTTLSGRPFQQNQAAPSQTLNGRPFRADLPPEPPTHHELDREALKTWVYPTNLGPIRDYQYSIVKNGLFNNTLVALPTGLGKTFIAATVMLNFLRWTKDAKIIFVAPTKPLASQQVSACLHIAGIPRSQAILLTGDTSPALREEEWKKRRVFFMTPQTLQNDLSNGYADPKSIALLVVDEAHRSTGEYAYVKAVKFIRRFSQSFRVLALTATPGSSVESVQEVIDNLGISHVEIRTEESIDLRPYTHTTDVEKVILDPSDEMIRVKELLTKALQPLCTKLGTQNVYWGHDPMSITTYQLVLQQKKWFGGAGRQANQGIKGMVLGLFAILQKVAHSIKLLNFHGINPFYDNLAEFRNEIEEKGGKGGKYKRQLVNDESFQEMMDMIEKWRKLDGFVSHPKITSLCERLLNHFMDAGEDANTRAIVFCEYRHSAEDIGRLLNKQPLIKATVFVGQADSKAGQGMTQKRQIETIEQFKKGVFNVLVATSVGEEGLDIGQVDLIVCYDASSSPIRMLQRMGRTGRKRAGNIVLLLMKDKEDKKFEQAKDNYEQMQRMISDGSRFTLQYEMSARIVPRDIRPDVDKRDVSIPIENTQDTSLPEPKKGKTTVRKKASKKVFHMPDGVQTGFVKATSLFGRPAGTSAKVPAKQGVKQNLPLETDSLAELPGLAKVVLSIPERAEFNKLYARYGGERNEIEPTEVVELSLASYPEHQRKLQPTRYLGHGEYTRRMVKLFRRLGNSQDSTERYHKPYGEENSSSWKSLPRIPFADDTDEAGPSEHLREISKPSRKRQRNSNDSGVGDSPVRASPKKRAVARRPQKVQAPRSGVVSMFLDDADDGGEEEEEQDDEGEECSDLPVEPISKNSKRTASRGKGRSRKGNSMKRRGDHPEDFGDECERTSDIEETDGSDSGTDLEDFIVDDDDIVSTHNSTSTAMLSSLPTSPQHLLSRQGRRENQKQTTPSMHEPVFKPVQFAATQSQESDAFPDLDDILQFSSTTKTKPPPKKVFFSSTLSDEGVGELPQSAGEVTERPAARRKRPVVYDSDHE